MKQAFKISCMGLIAGYGSAGFAADPPAKPSAAPVTSSNTSKNPDMRGFLAQVDTNHDGRMSRAEWQAAGLPMSSFNMFENKRGYVTLEDYQQNPAPPGIDLNGDGILTVQEFKAFDKKMSGAKGPPGAGTAPKP